MGDIKINIPKEIMEKLQNDPVIIGRNMSNREIIEFVLAERAVDTTPRETFTLKSTKIYAEKWDFPVGDVLMNGIYAKGDEFMYDDLTEKVLTNLTPVATCVPWWVPYKALDTVRDRVKHLEGFTLVIRDNTTIDESATSPNIIKHAWQERRAGGRYSTNSRGHVALIGWTRVWLEISDVNKALDTLANTDYKDMPVCVVADMYRMDDMMYAKAFKWATDKFIRAYEEEMTD